MTREDVVEAVIRGAADEVKAIYMEEGTNPEVDRRLRILHDALRDALSLPREESAEGWAAWDYWRETQAPTLTVHRRPGILASQRVRIVAAPEGDAP